MKKSPNSELLFDLPPSPFIREFGESLREEWIEQPIVDLGCGTGRNSRYIAKLGHTVVGVNNRADEIAAAQLLTSQAGIENCSYVNSDIRTYKYRQPAGIVMVNEVLHLLSEAVGAAVLASARRATIPRGFHAVSGYLPTAYADRRLHYIDQEQLTESYRAANWQIIPSEIRPWSVVINGHLREIELATLIARKPANLD